MDSRNKGCLKAEIIAAISFFLVLTPLSGAEAGKSSLNVDWASTLKTGEKASKRKLNFATPAVADDHVYVGSSGGFFYSVNLKDGKKLWEIGLEGPVRSKALVEGDAIYVGDGKGVVYSIKRDNGDINWHAYIGEEVMTTPASDGKTIYVSTQNNSVFALDKVAGAVKWTARRALPFSALSLKGHSGPQLIGDRIYVGDTDGVLVVYGAADGRKIATFPFATGRGLFTDIDTTPLKDGGHIILSSMEGGLYSVDYATGREVWSRPVGTPNNIAYMDGRIFVAAGGKVYCMDAGSGDIAWEKDLRPLEADELSEAALSGAFVAVISTNDKVFVLKRADGEIVLERHLGGGSFGSPIITDGRLIVLTNKGNLYAFRLNEEVLQPGGSSR